MITESVASTPKSSRPKAVKISRVAAKREADVAKEKGFAGADATGREPTSLGARSWSRGFSFSVLTGGVVAGVLDGVTTGVTGSGSGCGFGAGSGSGSGSGAGAGGGGVGSPFTSGLGSLGAGLPASAPKRLAVVLVERPW